ncbi:MAG: PASTA domain-containing protein, partial [Ruminococcus sp.]|nr:PASTA domain-containing protein [Candidatus Copronaster equi]
SEPTKYIPNVKKAAAQNNAVVQDEEYDEDEDEEKGRTKTVPKIIAVVLALVVVLGITFTMLSHFGYFSTGNEKKVPNFINQTYSAEDFTKKYPDFKFKIVQKVDASKAPDTILGQNPPAGEKIDPENTTITLTVSTNAEMITIPKGLMGSEYTDVISKLEIAGLQVKLKKVDASEYSNDIDPGTVVNVTPSEETLVSKNSVVVVEYISYDEGKEELVLVPDVSNLTETAAKQILKTSGFNVTTNYEYSDKVQDGSVIKNSLAKTKVPKGSSITLTVSKGNKKEQTVNITLQLPDKDSERVSSRVTLDGTTVKEEKLVLDGSDYKITVKGSEESSVVKFYVDGNLFYKCNINFASDKPKPENESLYDLDNPPEDDEDDTPATKKSGKGTIPDVIGSTKSEAMIWLKREGFSKLKIESIESDKVGSGDVAKVSPGVGKTVDYNTEVVLYVKD